MLPNHPASFIILDRSVGNWIEYSDAGKEEQLLWDQDDIRELGQPLSIHLNR